MNGPPVFLVGAARSGTSLLYKMLCLHPDTGWISNWVRRYPRVPELALLNRVARMAPAARRRAWFGLDGANAYVYGAKRSLWERSFPAPVEGGPVFRSCGLSDSALTSSTEEPARALHRRVSRITRIGGGHVFVNKRIENNRRIAFLREAFEHARFVELVRDGRAVACSLARVDWWMDSEVWFYGGTPRDWQAEGRDPWELCARNWVAEVRVVQDGLREVPRDQVLTVRYESLLERPIECITEIGEFSGLRSNANWLRHVNELTFPHRSDSWRQTLPPEVVRTIEAVQADDLRRLNYVG